jgi:RNA polymerase sigma-70 factor (ECF subfamily)
LINLLFPLISKDIGRTLTDEEIVKEYLATQNVAYFDKLYDRYSGKIYAKSISLLRDEDLAEDAVQEIFMKILLNLSKFSGKSKVSTWIYSITYNFCIDIIRRKKKDPSMLMDNFSGDNDMIDDVEDAFLLETNIRRLKTILGKIPSSDKAILLMKYQDDMSIRDIGSILDKSESAIKMKIKRAKHKFKTIYVETYPD